MRTPPVLTQTLPYEVKHVSGHVTTPRQFRTSWCLVPYLEHRSTSAVHVYIKYSEVQRAGFRQRPPSVRDSADNLAEN